MRNALVAGLARGRGGRAAGRASERASCVGRSSAMVALRDRIAAVAPTEATVLVRGESGTGKELVAAALHRLSRRSKGPFVKVNCAAISPSPRRGRALRPRARGVHRRPGGEGRASSRRPTAGRCFLDEIGDMEPGLQARLLRVLEDGKVRRLGDTREVAVDVRVMASTHRDLERAVREGRFRSDLYFRLARLLLDRAPAAGARRGRRAPRRALRADGVPPAPPARARPSNPRRWPGSSAIPGPATCGSSSTSASGRSSSGAIPITAADLALPADGAAARRVRAGPSAGRRVGPRPAGAPGPVRAGVRAPRPGARGLEPRRRRPSPRPATHLPPRQARLARHRPSAAVLRVESARRSFLPAEAPMRRHDFLHSLSSSRPVLGRGRSPGPPSSPTSFPATASSTPPRSARRS